MGSAALDMAYVAAGRCDCFWQRNLSYWDIAAGIILVKEAGGFITDFSGKNEYIQNETGNSANIIMGVGEDLELGNNISVTVIATGFGDEKQKSI